MDKILVLRGGALGDFIVTLPALALLRARWPRARIELAGNSTAAQLALNRGLIDAVHSQHEGRWAHLYGSEALPLEFARWLATFDLVISFWPDPDRELQRRFPACEGQQFLSSSAAPSLSPAAAHYCAPLRALGLEPRSFFHLLAPLAPKKIPDSAPARELILDHSSRAIVIHPGSGSPRKNWPADNWRTLIAGLPGPLGLVLGDAELAMWNTMPLPRNEAPGPGAETSTTHRLVNAPLEALVRVFAACRLFLGHDSGISHLAAASGARCVLLFGPTESACWAPPAPNVRVIRNGPDLASLSVSVVRDAVEAALADRT